MAAHIWKHLEFDGSGVMEKDELMRLVDRVPPAIGEEERQRRQEQRQVEAENFREKLMQFRNSFRNMDYHARWQHITTEQ